MNPHEETLQEVCARLDRLEDKVSMFNTALSRLEGELMVLTGVLAAVLYTSL